MTTKTDALIDKFSNGKLPTGENFADLIRSMVDQDTFNEHLDKLAEFEARGDYKLGTSPKGWHLGVNSEDQVRLVRGDGPDGHSYVAQGKVTGDIQLEGWTSLSGRIGQRVSTDAFTDTKTELDVAGLDSIDSDGTWRTIVLMPGHPCAFEVTAATARTVYPKYRGGAAILRTLTGMTSEQNGIVHGMVTAVGGNRRPTLSLSAQPDPLPGWGALLVYLVMMPILVLATLLMIGGQSEVKTDTVLLGLATALRDAINKPLEALNITFVSADTLTFDYLPLVLIALSLLYALRSITRAIHLSRSSVKLRWKKTAGTALMDDRNWSLQLQGPKFAPSAEQAKVYFTITKLWN